jgi:DNA mismatch repair protein MutS2
VHAFRVLEFDRILQRLVTFCETELGAAKASELAPSFAEETVVRLLGETTDADEFFNKLSPPGFEGISDDRAELKRAAKGGVLDAKEVYRTGSALRTARNWKAALKGQAENFPYLAPRVEFLFEDRKLEERILDSVQSDGMIPDSASPKLAELRAKKKQIVARILDRLQQYVSGKTRELLSDPIYTSRDGRYVLPLKAENRGKIRGIVHDTSASGQTIYVEPDDVLQLGNSLREAESAERTEENRILADLSKQIGAKLTDLLSNLEILSDIDLIFAKAKFGHAVKGAVPTLKGTAQIRVEGGRHPLLDPEVVVPLDLEVGKKNSVLITGPNTGGKTVAIKAIGLFVLMAQSGMMVPARQVTLGPFTQIWADIGDEQSLQQSLSTFSGHIKNIAEALKWAKPGALALFDELGAGTDPAEGAALAAAILKKLDAQGVSILASTHYGELKAFALKHESFTNAAMEFDGKTLRPTYRLLMNAIGASHALKIAERYGIKVDVIEDAKTNLGDQHLEISDMMQRLEAAQKQARAAQSEADRRAEELRTTEQRLQKKLKEAEESAKRANLRATEAIESGLRELRLEAADVFEQLKKAPHDPNSQGRARERLANIQTKGEVLNRPFKQPARQAERPAPRLTVGDTVKMSGFAQSGTVLSLDGKEATVQMGAMRMTVAVHRLEKTAAPMREARQNKLSLAKTLNTSTELHLRHMRAEDAIGLLDKFIDDAVLAGHSQVRIVHGKGEGILRKITGETLGKHAHVREHRLADASDGGDGVTIAVLK